MTRAQAAAMQFEGRQAAKAGFVQGVSGVMTPAGQLYEDAADSRAARARGPITILSTSGETFASKFK